MNRWIGMTLGLLLCATMGCSTSRSIPDRDARMATNLPDHFLVGSFTDDELREPVPGEGCRNPMIDPRDGKRLTLIRSSEDRGDYLVPDQSYGTAENELLRLDCSTGRAVGIVPAS